MNKTIRNSLLLLITAIVWGVAFVAQDVGMEYLTPFTFNGVRNLLGAAVLVPVIALNDKHKGEGAYPWKSKTLWIGGALCGMALALASNLQQYGIKMSDSSVGKAGFITAFYIILVPVIGIFLKRSCPKNVWAAVLIALVGLYFLCIPQGTLFSVELSDILVFMCAVVFAIQILIIDKFAPKVDPLKLACIEFIVCGVISSILALIFDDISIKSIAAAYMPILYAGVFSCGVGYTLQMVGQKGLNPAIASIIMSFESCVSVIAAWLIQGNAMSVREMMGCAIMLAAIILAQIPAKKEKTK
jgi:drug/metabolite transporter (DMT)-like permease